MKMNRTTLTYLFFLLIFTVGAFAKDPVDVNVIEVGLDHVTVNLCANVALNTRVQLKVLLEPVPVVIALKTLQLHLAAHVCLKVKIFAILQVGKLYEVECDEDKSGNRLGSSKEFSPSS
ncbi:5787_t:CDS:2 [Paraglomus brasilianum]|uniref:5787_t:CDS:1 n=1 Tax=Paraglomus brasilianum TaxID=144538 RepID=A0A9N8Z8Z0_9GLOM|nr:5787_t:CDS:2 [Paraglomus brasilianum]